MGSFAKKIRKKVRGVHASKNVWYKQFFIVQINDKFDIIFNKAKVQKHTYDLSSRYIKHNVTSLSKNNHDISKLGQK